MFFLVVILETLCLPREVFCEKWTIDSEAGQKPRAASTALVTEELNSWSTLREH